MKSWVMSESNSLLNKLQYVEILSHSFYQSDYLHVFINSTSKFAVLSSSCIFYSMYTYKHSVCFVLLENPIQQNLKLENR